MTTSPTSPTSQTGPTIANSAATSAATGGGAEQYALYLAALRGDSDRILDVATDLDAPVVLGVTVTLDAWHALHDGSADPQLLAALERAPQAVREMLAYAWTADALDNHPEVYRPSARLAEFIATRDRHPTNPTAGPTAASADQRTAPDPEPGRGGRLAHRPVRRSCPVRHDRHADRHPVRTPHR